MRAVLITGGAGFVGRHFTEYFLKQGDVVWCVDSLVKGTGAKDPHEWYFNPHEYDNFKFFNEDCRRFFEIEKDRKFDLVLHLAAIVGGRMMIEDRPIAVADDLSIDASFWQWAVHARPEKVITFSSSAAYPIRLQTKKCHKILEEGDIQFGDTTVIGRPDMSYGWSKLTSEYLGRLAFEKHGILSVVYRPFSGYGEDQGIEYPFAAIMKRVMESKGTVEVWGSGEQVRDWIHIDDVVAGVAKTMGFISDGTAINLSTGVATRFSELIQKAADILGKKVVVKPLLHRPEGVYYRCGSTEKQRKLCFDYQVSLEEGIKRFYEASNRHNNNK